MSETSPQPYQQLGSLLKDIRQKTKQTISDVSGAVEIDQEQLTQIEKGERCPTEDILSLLISHFGISGKEADRLWRLAGYDGSKQISPDVNKSGDNINPQPVMISPQDLKIVYTDMVHVMVNNYGVVINFMQGSGSMMHPLAVSRVGMSREHAQSVIEVLQKTLVQAETPSVPKMLPAPKDPTDP